MGEDVTPKQQERVKACETAEELLAFAAKEGMYLSKDKLKALSGGAGFAFATSTD